MALDPMLATQGGVCHIIGADCCTYIPDVSDNMTHVVSRLNDLLHEEKSQDSQDSGGWDMWSWLTTGGWKNMLFKMLTPLFVILCAFLLLTCCVIPCARSMIATAIKSSMGQYMQLHTAPTDSMEWIPPFSGDENEV